MRSARPRLCCAAGFFLAALASPAPAQQAGQWLSLCLDGDPQGEPGVVYEACTVVLEGGATGDVAERARFNRGLAAQMLAQQDAPALPVEPFIGIEIRPKARF